MRLENKVAIVTGSSRGIGKAIVKGFALENAKVVITYVTDKSAAHETLEEINNINGEGFVTKLDVTKRDNFKELFELTYERFGKIDILINNAGINKRGFFNEISDEDWDQVMSINLKGPFFSCQEVFPYMIKQNGGRIINISSVAGQYHGPKTVHYAVSKAGLNSLTKVVARYGAPYNILVNAVAPGIILTDQTRDELGSEAGQNIIDMTLLKKPGELRDVVNTCIFLASDEHSYITGQVISVSGGAYLG